jgi:hypothetical protein
MKQLYIKKVCTDDAHIYAETDNGIRACYAFDQWERLRDASKQDRESYQLSFSGIHWNRLDEDLSFTGMFIDNGLLPSSPDETIVCYPGYNPFQTDSSQMASEPKEYKGK